MSDKNRSKKINRVGDFDVMICDPYWQDDEEQLNKGQMCLVLPCYTDGTEENPESEYLDFYVYFSGTIIQSGKNQGRKLSDISADMCVALGMKAPFDPARIGELDAKLAVLVTREDEYNGKKTVKGAFLNPHRKAPMEAAKVAAAWAKIAGGKVAAPTAAAAKPAPATTAKPDDDLPFN